MLEAEISRLTGLMLVEIVEIAVIVASGIAAIGLTVTMLKSYKQTKIDSASLILELLNPWGMKDFKQLLSQMADPNITKYDETKLEEFLNRLEIIAVFWKDKTLTETHVKEFFGANIKTVRDDEFIQAYMKKWTDINPDHFFVNIIKLTKKVKKWGI